MFVDVVAVLRMLRFIGGPAASAVGTPTTDRNTVCRMMVRRRRGMFWVCGFVCSGDSGSRSWPDGLYDARFCLLGASRALPVCPQVTRWRSRSIADRRASRAAVSSFLPSCRADYPSDLPSLGHLLLTKKHRCWKRVEIVNQGYRRNRNAC